VSPVPLAGRLLLPSVDVAAAVVVSARVQMWRLLPNALVLMIQDDAVVDYSYVTVGTSTPGHSGHPNDFSVRWMQCCFFLFGQAMPLGLMVVLTITPIILLLEHGYKNPEIRLELLLLKFLQVTLKYPTTGTM
jgi:hypothetical protein